MSLVSLIYKVICDEKFSLFQMEWTRMLARETIGQIKEAR